MLWPTPDPAINDLLSRLLVDLQAILGRRLVGLYLHGSLAGGDFNPQRSDIDFAVVTEDEISEADFQSLKAMHDWITASDHPWAQKLEGGYLPRAAIRCYTQEQPAYPWLSEGGGFQWERFGPDWLIQCAVLREHGIAVYGPPPDSLIDPISAVSIREATRTTLLTWWMPQITDRHRLVNRTYQAYAAVTMCRMLYTLQTGMVASKPAAVRWAHATLDSRWGTLIDEALAWPTGPQPDRLEETVALIRWTIEKSLV